MAQLYSTLGIGGVIVLAAAVCLMFYGLVGVSRQQYWKFKEKFVTRKVAQENQKMKTADLFVNLESVADEYVQVNVHFDNPRSKTDLLDLVRKMSVVQCQSEDVGLVISDKNGYLFQIFNMSEDGTFGTDETLPSSIGIVFVSDMKKVDAPENAVDLMLMAAADMAQELHGDLLDEHDNQLSEQHLAYLRQKAKEFVFKNEARR